jgi:hypothetical protein
MVCGATDAAILRDIATTADMAVSGNDEASVVIASARRKSLDNSYLRRLPIGLTRIGTRSANQ